MGILKLFIYSFHDFFFPEENVTGKLWLGNIAIDKKDLRYQKKMKHNIGLLRFVPFWMLFVHVKENPCKLTQDIRLIH